jgi:predicted peroxiredoxin
MFKSAWGSDDPTKAAFAFLHGNALAEAGHSVQIFLLGEATSLMRASVAHAVVPVGWPPVVEALTKATANKIQIYACGACSRAQWPNALRQANAELPGRASSMTSAVTACRCYCFSGPHMSGRFD